MSNTPTRAIGFMSSIQVGRAQGDGGVGFPLVAFGVKTAKIDFNSDEFEVGDTVSGPFKRHQPGRYMFAGNFTAFIDTSVQTFNPAVFGFVAGNAIWLNYYPSGQIRANQFTNALIVGIGATINLPGGGGNDPYICPNFVIFNSTTTTDVGAPVTVEFSGKADNAFRQPSRTG